MKWHFIIGLKKKAYQTKVHNLNITEIYKQIYWYMITYNNQNILCQKILLIFGFMFDTYIMHGVQEFCQLIEPLPVLTGVSFPLDNGFS